MNSEKAHLIGLENLKDLIKLTFKDDYCEELDCNECPFFIRAVGVINRVECTYLCDFLYQIKEKI